MKADVSHPLAHPSLPDPCINPTQPFQTHRMSEFLLKKTMGVSQGVEAEAKAEAVPLVVTPPRPLDLALSPASIRHIAAAEVAFDNLVDAHEVSC